MKLFTSIKVVMWALLLLSFNGLSFNSNAQGLSQQDYLLDTGDRIEIRVLGEEDLSFEVTLGLNATLQYPFLGQFNVQQKTLAEVREMITNGLKGDYLDNPDVDVNIVTYRPFFILGEVMRPQNYPFQPGLTVNRAIAIAGGFTERASRTNIELRRAKDGSTVTITERTMDTALFPGDEVIVKQSFF
jgi:protein involved in polysaccharide export with SLBB domain